jgi:hypothetical protein
MCWICHDWGYWWKPNLDGEEGIGHPELGAKIMSIFGNKWKLMVILHSGFYVDKLNKELNEELSPGYKHPMNLYKPSKLYYADKLASVLYPRFLYRLLSGWSGEYKEYRINHLKSKGKLLYEWHPTPDKQIPTDGYYLKNGKIVQMTFDDWHKEAMEHMRKRAYENQQPTIIFPNGSFVVGVGTNQPSFEGRKSHWIKP